jgi:hypothetical protein
MRPVVWAGECRTDRLSLWSRSWPVLKVGDVPRALAGRPGAIPFSNLIC